MRARQTTRGSELRRRGAAYQGALEAVFAILVAGGIGYAADGYFDTSPIFLFVGLAVGFGSFVLRLLRLGRELDGSADGEEDDGQGERR